MSELLRAVGAGAAILYLFACCVGWFIATLTWFATREPERVWVETYPRRRDRWAFSAVVWGPVWAFVLFAALAAGRAWVAVPQSASIPFSPTDSARSGAPQAERSAGTTVVVGPAGTLGRITARPVSSGAPLPPTAPMGGIPEGVKPMSATSLRDGRTGTISHMGPGYPADYLALPIGPGHAVHICGVLGCLDLTSTDAGPNHDSLVAGRIADVSVELFHVLCGPEIRGLCRGSWRTIAAGPTLPETDTEGETP